MVTGNKCKQVWVGPISSAEGNGICLRSYPAASEAVATTAQLRGTLGPGSLAPKQKGTLVTSYPLGEVVSHLLQWQGSQGQGPPLPGDATSSFCSLLASRRFSGSLHCLCKICRCTHLSISVSLSLSVCLSVPLSVSIISLCRSLSLCVYVCMYLLTEFQRQLGMEVREGIRLPAPGSKLRLLRGHPAQQHLF